MAHVGVVNLCLLLFMLFCLAFSAAPGSPHKKFEYKLSFKGPHLVQKDGTVPFWEHGGNAIASDESIRITPSLRSKKGRVWSKNKNTHEHWEVEVVFRISGRGRVGADGLAIWYTEQPGTEGPVFGSNDQWKGLAIFFDSFDNDGQHNNPYVMTMYNDGTKAYDHNTDGASQQLGGCLRDFRNKPFPVRAKIEYYNNAITLYVHNGMTSTGDQYELCMRAENVYLPREGYFGVTAATGGLADDHDVQAFLTHSLTAPDTAAGGGQQVSDDDRKKFEQEFDDYYQKLQKAKEEFRKEHPEKQQFEDDEDRWFEEQGARELKQIFEGQNYIGKTVGDLHRKMDEVIGRQERTLSQLSLMSQAGGGSVQNQGQQNQGGQVPMIDTIKRFEVDNLMANTRELLNNMREFRMTINDIHAKAGNLQNAGGNQGGSIGYQDTDMKNNINTLVHDMKTLLNKPQVTAPACPPSTTSCISPFMFFVFVAIQITVFIGYSVYKSSKEAAAKKFY